MPVRTRAALAVKRLLDCACAAIGIVVLAPVFFAIAIAIKVESPRHPLFFNDVVMGRNAVRFKLLKFRTMVPHAIDYTNRPEVRAGSSLVTRVGRVLRRLKLDELPQLFNVLSGQMSIVGPRPMDPHRYERATPFERQRLLMRPGLSGWVQVNGNINWDWDRRMQMDLWYIDQWSLALDFKILLATMPVIVFGERVGDRSPARITDTSYRLTWPGAGLASYQRGTPAIHQGTQHE